MLKYLYGYQKEAVDKALADNKGVMCMPTGTGKTFVQCAMATTLINSIKK